MQQVLKIICESKATLSIDNRMGQVNRYVIAQKILAVKRVWAARLWGG